jgi:hypothetical protein
MAGSGAEARFTELRVNSRIDMICTDATEELAMAVAGNKSGVVGWIMGLGVRKGVVWWQRNERLDEVRVTEVIYEGHGLGRWQKRSHSGVTVFPRVCHFLEYMQPVQNVNIEGSAAVGEVSYSARGGAMYSEARLDRLRASITATRDSWLPSCCCRLIV